MIILVLGMVLIIIGALSIQFRELCNALKKSDETQWKQLGSPEGFSVTDLGKTISVYNWVLSYGFETSKSTEIQKIGKKALKRAFFVKYTLLWGCLILVVGFILTIIGF